MSSIDDTYGGGPKFSWTFAPVTGEMEVALLSIFKPGAATPFRPAYFSDVSKVTFSRSNALGDIAIGSYEQDTASAFLPDGTAHGGDLWLGLDMTSPSPQGTYLNFVLLHEIGHSLGLEHGNLYPDGGHAYAPHLAPKFDSMSYTIMSYNLDPNAGGNYPVGLQQFDIAALQQMYGVSYATRADDTVYKFTSSPGILTIWDGGGKDKIDTRNINERVIINLQPGEFSSIGGKENVAMALVNHLPTLDQEKPLLENAVAGAGDDDLTGNSAKNILEGGGGKNKLIGLEGNDILVSVGDGDTLEGGKGKDALINQRIDGNTQYVFSKGDGHDGIVDVTLGDHDGTRSPDNIDVILKGIDPADVKIYSYREQVAQPVDPSITDNWFYLRSVLMVESTGDTLFLPWIYRDTVLHNHDSWYDQMFNYAQDSIQFDNGTVWDMQQFEKYATPVTTDLSVLLAGNPDFLAWITADIEPYLPPDWAFIR